MSRFIANTLAGVLRRSDDGITLKCPVCAQQIALSDDQYHGLDYVDHECGFHFAGDFAAALQLVGWSAE